MAHISPSFRRAARVAQRYGLTTSQYSNGSKQGSIAAGWRAIGWPAKAALCVAAAGLAFLVFDPAHALSNAETEPDATAAAVAAATPAPAATAPDAAVTARPAARPARLAAADPTSAAAQPPAAEVQRGPVTRLPIPRYVSLKGDRGNVRRGPSLSHRIDWVFNHAGMPLRVVGEFGQWRRIEDQDGAGGWVHYRLLSGVRTAIIQQDMTELRARPDLNSGVMAMAEGGSIVKLGECNANWCRVSGQGSNGWVPKTAIWGVDAAELRD